MQPNPDDLIRAGSVSEGVRVALRKKGILTVRHLAQHTEYDVVNTRGVGVKTLQQLRWLVEEYGLKFKEPHL
jgi:DNA-directed RNA polymerase alpha subunit